jgi:hypothetical protein
MWENIVESERLEMIIGRMRFACWITKATDTHPEYVILISFPVQQWLHESALMLNHTHIVCLVEINSDGVPT